FLTGFDSKYLNTLYVDKNLKYHGLIQAFSRTNRILGERKTSGNIVCFRNLKERVDEAIKLFSNADASGKVLMKPYEDYVREFNETAERLKELVASPSDVDDLISETDKADFIQIFRNLIRVKNRLEVYTDFDFNHLDLSAQEFTNYSTKYLDLYDFVKNNTEKDKVSILEELDFELELIRTDKINVDYILMLLSELDPTAVNYKKDVEFILNTMESNENLRSKRELIKEFIEKELNGLEPNVEVEDKFVKYVNFKKTQEFSYLIEEENLDGMKVEEYIEDYAFSGKKNSDLLKESVIDKLGLLEKRRKINLVIEKVNNFIERYSW
ncbi:MAG: type I restriction endonuclease subunit R, partial [Leptotrichiaceae bacterium]|nr:type I restriction endonuclease subunit R [Leptotrichiaceae bacterium]